MPELPEVEVVRRGIEPAVSFATVTAVEVLDERSLRRHPGPSEDFVERMTGAVLGAPARRGKFLWVPLLPRVRQMQEIPDASREIPAPDSPTHAESPAFRTMPERHAEALVVHLGMSGQILLRGRGTDDPLTRIRLDLDSPHGALRLNFVDQRIFGSMAIDSLVPAADHAGERVPTSVAHIARDPLDPLFDDAWFLARLATKRTGIKRALLDQNLISGVGNIYADEALWHARLHYDQPANTVSRAKARELLAAVRDVFAKALIEGGTSFDAQYVNVNGESGYFSHSLVAYGQHDKPCPRCGATMAREPWMNRNSHFCPRCQRLR
ncbi:MAG: bifunctional DNA-formamidopyrimidine glycosylase/DNA-(apurinic or apyrimidinic site) lyase [Cryobacterium sp.]|nr:bifunctional DNA-formamidopyrimidine glycosylase/DNA-(apurinic or apyrimidinic site) lyase [Cryobacterium sp.]